MNLRDLRYLVAVADLRHFGQAAEKCFVSQPTLSAQIKKLEGELKVQLFERTNKRVNITPVGEEIVKHARNILAEADRMREKAQVFSDPFGGDLRLGVIPTIGPYLVPHLLKPMRAAMPKLHLQIHEDQTARIVDALFDGQLDVLLLAVPIDVEGVRSVDIGWEPFVAVLPASSALASRSTVTLPELQRESLYLLADGHCLRDHALSFCDLNSVNETFKASSLETLRQMVSLGSGVSIFPLLAAPAQHDADDDVVYRPFTGGTPGRSIAMMWRPESGRAEAIMRLAEVFRSAMETLFSTRLRALEGA